MEQKSTKAGANEKSANLRVSAQMDRLLTVDFPADFELELECECANLECHGSIMITRAQYADVLRRGSSYMVRPNHSSPEDEIVERQHDQYWIVRKRATRVEE
jgi:hypothetical protein